MARFSKHARRRAGQRGIKSDAVDAAFEWGRIVNRPGGAVAYIIGRKEIKKAAERGHDISDHNGVSIVVGMGTEKSGVITTFRNKSLKVLKRPDGWTRSNKRWRDG